MATAGGRHTFIPWRRSLTLDDEQRDSSDTLPDAWLAIDLTIAFQTARWWIPFGTPAKIIRLGKAGYIVHLVPPVHGAPPTIYVPGLDSLLWERPDPDTVAQWIRYKSAFKEILRRKYEPRLHQLWEKLKLLTDREAAGPAPETLMDRMKERDGVMDELRDMRDTTWKAAGEKARVLAKWSGPNPRQVGDWIP